MWFRLMRSVRKLKGEQTEESVFFSVLCNISPDENNHAESQAHNYVTSRKRNEPQRGGKKISELI